jgi:Fe2+ transport system protein B
MREADFALAADPCNKAASWKWTAFLFSYMLALAYLSAFLVYHIGVWLGGG